VPDAVGVSVDALGTVYVACQSSNTVITTSPAAGPQILAGTGMEGFFRRRRAGNGGNALFASGVFVDSSGAITIADSGNNRIRRVAGNPVAVGDYVLSRGRIYQ